MVQGSALALSMHHARVKSTDAVHTLSLLAGVYVLRRFLRHRFVQRRAAGACSVGATEESGDLVFLLFTVPVTTLISPLTYL